MLYVSPVPVVYCISVALFPRYHNYKDIKNITPDELFARVSLMYTRSFQTNKVQLTTTFLGAA